jgi:DICT domain-containing protein
MKSRFPVALTLAALALAACSHRGDTSVSLGDDDTFCRGNNVQVGSPEYAACRKDRDVQHANAAARADQKQRGLAEYMLNNPVRP